VIDTAYPLENRVDLNEQGRWPHDCWRGSLGDIRGGAVPRTLDDSYPPNLDTFKF
jgi:hypothetical protein